MSIKFRLRVLTALTAFLFFVGFLVLMAPAGDAATSGFGTYNLSISATSGWQGNIRIPAGSRYTISAPQQGEYWTVDRRSVPYVGAFGNNDADVWGGNTSCKFTQDAPYAMLLVKLNSDVQRYDEIDGRPSSFDRDVSFRINDANNCLGYNSGSLPVIVSVG